MYWWKLQALRDELAARTLSERTRFQYLLLFLFLSAIAIELPPPTNRPTVWDRANSVTSMLVTVLGTWWLFRINGGGEGRRFLERYLSLAWVVLLRFLVFSLPVMALLYLAGELAGIASEKTGPFYFAVFSGWLIAYYGLLGRNLRLVRDAERAS
ncbi:MAG TPA: hypothetical protein VLC53_15880 [Myxococcota bacterium]|nr:hypothetical protein [Myxococcota bacterium]